MSTPRLPRIARPVRRAPERDPRPTEPRPASVCSRKPRFATEARAKAAWKVQRGTWVPVPCACGGWHIERPKEMR